MVLLQKGHCIFSRHLCRHIWIVQEVKKKNSQQTIINIDEFLKLYIHLMYQTDLKILLYLNRRCFSVLWLPKIAQCTLIFITLQYMCNYITCLYALHFYLKEENTKNTQCEKLSNWLKPYFPMPQFNKFLFKNAKGEHDKRTSA